MSEMLQRATNLFPLWVLIAGAVAWVHPPALTWFDRPWIVWGLGIIMLGMGLTLQFEDFFKVSRTPLPILLGVGAQYLVMPALGWWVATLFSLPKEFAVGLILVGCCPGGTASNVVTYLARANLPLSVLMTMVSTFAAIGMTPLLTEALVGARAPVDAWGMFLTTLKIVLAPLLMGLTLRRWFPKSVRRVVVGAPLISVIFIALICGSILGSSAETLKEYGLPLLGAVFLLHSGGFALGYALARLFGYDEAIRRTVSIEVGMQNSGLGSALATTHFNLLTAAPCSVSAAMHSVIGSFLAAIWRRAHRTRS